MEAAGEVQYSFFSILDLVGFLFFHQLLARAQKLLGSARLPRLLCRSSAGAPPPAPPAAEASIRPEEIKMVVRRLGLMEEGDGEIMGVCGDLYSTFEAQEPSCEEVMQAFMVFDRNGDGYIDAGELAVVLRVLGLGEAAAAEEACRRMIAAFDDNGDGRIDFPEFGKLMEGCLSS